MAELKTQPTGANVHAFLNSVENDRRRQDAFHVLDIFTKVTGYPAEMWGPAIIGFGRYRYVYASGRSGEWMLTGFSPRKQNLVLYIMSGFQHFDELLGRLGKFKTGKGCLYINKLEDIDLEVLEKLIRESVTFLKSKHE